MFSQKMIQRLDAKDRTTIRKMFGAPNNVPVIEADVTEPTLVGENGGWFTSGGTRIYYPNAYAKKGRSNMRYIPSTRKILIPRKSKCQAES